MATTTAAAIRDRAIAVIKALVPTSDEKLRFTPYQNELGADFRKAMLDHPPGAHRMFQVRTSGRDRGIEVTNEDVEEHWLELEVVVAYPQDHRWGPENALDRDDVMDQDQHMIEDAIGWRGSANFTTLTNADACWRDSLSAADPWERVDGVDFLVIKQLFSYYRSV